MVIVFNGKILQLSGHVIAGVMLFFQRSFAIQKIDDDYIASRWLSAPDHALCMIAFNATIFAQDEIQAKMSPAEERVHYRHRGAILHCDRCPFNRYHLLLRDTWPARPGRARGGEQDEGATAAVHEGRLRGTCPSLNAGQIYHVFLSHVWGTGQTHAVRHSDY